MTLTSLVAALLLGPTPADSTAVELIRDMHDRYAGRWPQNVTFVQKSTFYEGDSTRVETWYESVGPGTLRIDFADCDAVTGACSLAGGNGVLFRGDSIYQFKGDSLAMAAPQPHSLMVLSRDVYERPAEETVARLRQLGFDLSKVHDDTWQGRPVYVVGAEADDLKSPQFWVDKENLLFVRLIEPGKQNPDVTLEIQFNKYQPLGGGWIETEVVFLANGKRVMLEEYREMRHDVEFEETLFDPSRWGRPAWVPMESE